MEKNTNTAATTPNMQRATLDWEFITNQRIKLQEKRAKLCEAAQNELQETGSLSSLTEAQQQRRLAPIDLALAKIPKGTYGICVCCLKPIEVFRLERTPEAEICCECIKRETGKIK
jgi:RNA polymerase-binding transcription factor DksA